MSSINEKIINELFKNKDEKYRDFSSKLMPNIEKENIIGVRTPVIRKLSVEFKKEKDIDIFLNTLPHKYYEENNLHAFLIEKISDFSTCISYTEKFLPFVNNWATCDSMNPKIFKKHKKELLTYIEKWIKSDDTYAVRFGIEMLMNHFLDGDFLKKHLKMVADIKSDEYYVNMMRAWYFSTALAKQYEPTAELIKSKSLDKFTQNKSIQKAIESFRITDTKKQYLRTLKV